MNKLKKNVLITGLSVLLVTGAASTFAGGFGRDDSHRSGAHMDYIYAQLALTKETQAAVTDILDDLRDQNRDEMRAAMDKLFDADTKPTREQLDALRAEHQAEMTTEYTDKLNTVLSADQTAELVKYLNAHGPAMRMMGGDRDREDRPHSRW